MDDDYLIDRLTALVAAVASKEKIGEKEARVIVAAKAGASEPYIYQIIKRKPMADGKLRVPGREMRKKLSAAYPNWLDMDHQAAPIVVPPTIIAEPPRAVYDDKPRRTLVQQVCELAERLDDAGLLKLQGYAACLLADHPLAKPKAA